MTTQRRFGRIEVETSITVYGPTKKTPETKQKLKGSLTLSSRYTPQNLRPKNRSVSRKEPYRKRLKPYSHYMTGVSYLTLYKEGEDKRVSQTHPNHNHERIDKVS